MLTTNGADHLQVVRALRGLGATDVTIRGEDVDVTGATVDQAGLDAALFAEAKRARRGAVNAERDGHQHLGLPYAFPDAVTGTIDTRNGNDQANILGLHAAALGLMATAPDTVFCTFRDAEDQDHDLTPSQMAALYQAVMARRTALYQHGWTLKGQIEAAADAAALDAIDVTAGWPALPTP